MPILKTTMLVFIMTLSACASKGNKEIAALKKTYGKIYKREVERIEFNQLVVFSCENIPNSRYLLNKDRTNVCWMENPSDVLKIVQGLREGSFLGADTVFVQDCPEELTMYRACDPTKLRNF